MRSTDWSRLGVTCVILALAFLSEIVPVWAADPAVSLTYEQKEQFLKTARVVQQHSVSKGVTATVRVTMASGTVTHDASVQRIDDFKFVFQGDDGSREANFKDTYRFNIAAWKLARMLGIDDMIPPSIERSYEGMPGSFTWWIDDVQMDEGERVKDGVSAPDTERWDQEMQVVHVFDELIYNTDRNLTNLLIDKQWRIWMIDHTRAFRAQHDLRNNKNLVKCDRNLLAKMKALDAASLGKQLSHYVSNEEIRGLLARRDTIVRFFEQKGAAALYDRRPRT